MKFSFNNDWANIKNYTLEKVVDLVLTNGTTYDIHSDVWILNYMGECNEKKNILDFGCGIGRNIFDFSTERPNWNFTGYDNHDMLKKANEYSLLRFKKTTNEYTNLLFESEWDKLKDVYFDCIYATIVFQHIFESDLNRYISDIKSMTNRLIVTGRRFNDDVVDGNYKNTWQILENNGFYPSNAKEINYSIDGDPNEHITCIYDI